jgi:hypothetical protein
MSMGTRLFNRPAFAFGATNRPANMFVGMPGHFLVLNADRE